MGKTALALNIADNGFQTAVYNRNSTVTADFMANAGDLAERLTPAETVDALVSSLERPRAVLVMVTAGAAVDSVIEGLLPLLDEGDQALAGVPHRHHHRDRQAATDP